GALEEREGGERVAIRGEGGRGRHRGGLYAAGQSRWRGGELSTSLAFRPNELRSASPRCAAPSAPCGLRASRPGQCWRGGELSTSLAFGSLRASRPAPGRSACLQRKTPGADPRSLDLASHSGYGSALPGSVALGRYVPSWAPRLRQRFGTAIRTPPPHSP